MFPYDRSLPLLPPYRQPFSDYCHYGLVLHINGIIDSAHSCLTSFPQFTVSHISIPFSLLSNIQLYEYTHNLFVHSFVDGLLSCFWFLAIIMIILIQVLWWAYIFMSLEYMSGNTIAGS